MPKVSDGVFRSLRFTVGIADLASVTVGKTFPIRAESGAVDNGNADVTYSETGNGTKVWFGEGGSVVVAARSGNTITLRVVDAVMSPLVTGGTGEKSTGVFTINATGQFTPQ